MADQKPVVITANRPTEHDGSADNLDVGGPLINATIDANGTGNAITNIDVADLANGTDGELITWSATAGPASVDVANVGMTAPASRTQFISTS